MTLVVFVGTFTRNKRLRVIVKCSMEYDIDVTLRRVPIIEKKAMMYDGSSGAFAAF